MFHCLLTILAISYLPIGESVSVRLLVPEAVKADSSAILVCQFDLRGQQLYSVKWYRGNYEFFRFLPKEKPPAMAFNLNGINVDVSSSNAHQVVLLNLPAQVGGRFSCEVSAEGPRFLTASDYADLHVIDVKAMRRPEVHLSSNFYEINNLDKLSINCSCHPTLPPPIVHFYINNIKVNPEWIDIVNSGLASLSPKSIEHWIETQSVICTTTDQTIQESKADDDKSRIISGYDQPIWIRCEATLPLIYHFASADVPLFPQIEDQVSDGSHTIRRCVSEINIVITSMFLLFFLNFLP